MINTIGDLITYLVLIVIAGFLISMINSCDSKSIVRNINNFDKICIDSVTYVSHGSRFSVMLDVNSKIIKCGVNNDN